MAKIMSVIVAEIGLGDLLQNGNGWTVSRTGFFFKGRSISENREKKKIRKKKKKT